MFLLLIIHILITVFLIFVILIQKADGNGLGLSNTNNGFSNQFFNPRGSSNLLTKITTGLGFAFMINCLLMTSINSYKVKKNQNITINLEKINKDD